MKKKIICIIVISCFFPVVKAQVKIASERININFDKVKHIVLPATVTDVTVGSKQYISAKIIPDAPNIVSVSAVEEKFPVLTNLTIICNDGKAYSYMVSYSDSIPEGDVLYPGKNTENIVYNVIVNKDNATVLFFPGDIIYFKQGNEDAIELTKAHNVLKVTTRNKIYPSNIFCVDSKNQTYNINVQYSTTDSYVYNFNNDTISTNRLAIVDVNELEMDSLLEKTIRVPRAIYSMGVIKDKFEFSLSNVLIKNDMLFFVFEMKNSSNIDFDVDFIKCFFVDKKITKNAIQQETVVDFIYQNNLVYKIPAKQKNKFVLVFNKFTIPDDKFFKVEIYEKGGGRHINFNINNNIIINSQTF